MCSLCIYRREGYTYGRLLMLGWSRREGRERTREITAEIPDGIFVAQFLLRLPCWCYCHCPVSLYPGRFNVKPVPGGCCATHKPKQSPQIEVMNAYIYPQYAS